ncbi:Lrp/AsnC family transcriptional regulator [Lactonifactor longoviformis]|uniref:DNA-binding transcriptional regulator, Lrp family n=1 Tax=Lactonifactor longoviformis DSM 17459 TaxID=1122155 RepID=A0A1M4SRW8_9CLOT|nr:Lrp/AsnC family transcriptional regulator [Lactonifactor longoviformis]POP31626.1 Lrp/AsnC family transcriptional regulator [Lactonifactor longoviformis]SHE34994.1 DNA-binding transcriptional regulator, Lrp family [Lactonifactor longoviformis DSM 17459]
MDVELRKEILRLLERNARLSAEEIGVMAGRPADEVQKIIRELENEQVICGYHTLINWNKEEEELVTALVELKVTPQGGDGYNKIAEQIYQYPQVETLYLMSGAYDFLVELKGKTIKEISMFVSENLASMDEVQSTATYFTLTKYKEQGVNLIKKKQDGRMVITP